jgi:signal transduction histidine kinase
MRPADFFARTLRRADARAALAIGGLLLLAVGAQGAVLYAYVAMENLEEADLWIAHLSETLEGPAQRGTPIASVVGDMRRSLGDRAPSVRVRNDSGELIDTWGHWPESASIAAAESGEEDGRKLTSGLLLGHQRFLVSDVTLQSGVTVEVALPLAHFAAETAEVGSGLAVVSLASGLIALVIALIATARAFSPLRRATALLKTVDEHNLRQRLPMRGTDDPVDNHARTLNRVLEKIDTSFSRLRSFTSDAAHELRTPLNRIGTVAEVALLEGDSERLRSGIESIQRTSEELSSMVRSLLLLAEMDEATIAPAGISVDAQVWLQRIAEIYAPLFEEDGVKLQAQSDSVTILGDPVLLDRVITNLLENALRYASPGDRVEIEAVQSEAGLRVSIDDSGPGIPAHERKRVFDRFSQINSDRSTPGSGLGLAVARAIARLHGGDLTVESSRLGGARFLWWIPADRICDEP